MVREGTKKTRDQAKFTDWRSGLSRPGGRIRSPTVAADDTSTIGGTCRMMVEEMIGGGTPDEIECKFFPLPTRGYSTPWPPIWRSSWYISRNYVRYYPIPCHSRKPRIERATTACPSSRNFLTLSFMDSETIRRRFPCGGRLHHGCC